MVQGHTIDAVLVSSGRGGQVLAAWSWLRGLTSVAFLLTAGLSFHLATLRDLAAHQRNRTAVLHRLRRAGTLLCVGYALHLPLAALLGPASEAAGAVQLFVAVDVLQCIGACLVLLECLAVLLPSRRAVEWAAGILGAGVLLISPRLVLLDPHGAFLPLLNYLTPRAGSLFPLFPWAAHVFIGVWLWGAVLDGQPRAPRWLIAAGLAHACAYGAGLCGVPLLHMHLARLGWVLIAGAACCAVEPVARRLPAFVWRISGETLFIYGFHVLMVYGQGFGLAARVGRTLAPFSAMLAALAMIALSFGLALVYAGMRGALARRA
jgi:hypothetical protein